MGVGSDLRLSCDIKDHIASGEQCFRDLDRSPEFQRMALNDVVEAAFDGSSFFVSEWLDHDNAAGHRAFSFTENLAHSAKIALKQRKTRLLKCVLQGSRDDGSQWSCSEATADRFVLTNGLAITPDRRFLFVSDPASTEVVIYRVDGASSLEALWNNF